MSMARYKLLAWMIAFVVAGLALRAAVGPNSAPGALVVAVIMAGLVGFTFADMRLADEFVRDAYKTSFFWGTIVGLSVWAVAFSVVVLRLGIDHVIWFGGHHGSLAIFAFGGLSTMIMLLACWLIALGAWRILKR